jgi:hypothetical protein
LSAIRRLLPSSMTARPKVELTISAVSMLLSTGVAQERSAVYELAPAMEWAEVKRRHVCTAPNM